MGCACVRACVITQNGSAGDAGFIENKTGTRQRIRAVLSYLPRCIDALFGVTGISD